MNTRDQIEQAVINFVKAGDNSDADLLEQVLHRDFRVSNNGFMGQPGITIIDRQKYLSNIREGIFGGLPRIMKIDAIDYTETIAMVKLRLESSENRFVSFNSLVLDIDKKWKLIENLAIVEPKVF